MGMDFSALMRYDGPRKCRAAITSFVRDAPAEFAAVLDLWRARDFFAFADKYQYNAWIDSETDRQVKRPNDDNVNVALRMPEGFFITFGRDTIRVYHLLRWVFFLTDPEWQLAMLDACAAIARHFNATDCVLAHDCHSAMIAFRNNNTFDRCFDSLGADEHEVPTIDDLSLEVDYHGEPCWGSTGFWRFDWREYVAGNAT